MAYILNANGPTAKIKKLTEKTLWRTHQLGRCLLKSSYIGALKPPYVYEEFFITTK